jgi:hypothetical protein
MRKTSGEIARATLKLGKVVTKNYTNIPDEGSK